VIQIGQSYVLQFMYCQTIDLKLSSLNELTTTSFDYIILKGINVEKGGEWIDLLLNVAAVGCQDSFRKIFNHFYPIIIGQGLKSGLTKEVAAELAQETMMRVWHQASSFDDSKGSASLWIYVIARNLKYDYLRKFRNDPLQASSQDIYSDDHSNLSSLDTVEALFDLSLLNQQIHKLPTQQRDIIHKIYFEGMTQQEISEDSNIPIGTVKSRVRLATATLKKIMEGK
jgi:RNA polymerase sigma-70 factor (ECF subfamily)